jgi:hypothetical protein
VINQIPVGTYSITRRLNLGSGFQNVVAELSEQDAERLLNLISVRGLMAPGGARSLLQRHGEVGNGRFGDIISERCEIFSERRAA